MKTQQSDTTQANAAPRCSYLRMDGQQCLAPALRGQPTCRFHRPKHPKDYHFPLIEDAASIQLALNVVIRAFNDGHWDQKTCGLMLHALRTAAGNLRNYALEMDLVEQRRQLAIHREFERRTWPHAYANDPPDLQT